MPLQGPWRRTISFFASLGVRIERVLTDNGPCYRSKAFNELIFDPATSALLEETEVITDPDQLGDGGLGPVGPVGSVLYSVVYLDYGVVDSTLQTPSG
jgi:hypothetical protein